MAGATSEQPKQAALEFDRHTGSVVQALFQLSRRKHQGITTERQLSQRPLLQTFRLPSTRPSDHQDQIKVAAKGGRATPITAEHTQPLQAWNQPLLLQCPDLHVLEYLLRGWPAPDGLLQRAHGHG